MQAVGIKEVSILRRLTLNQEVGGSIPPRPTVLLLFHHQQNQLFTSIAHALFFD